MQVVDLHFMLKIQLVYDQDYFSKGDNNALQADYFIVNRNPMI